MSADRDALERLRLHSEICKVLTDPKRLLLLQALRGGDRTVSELAGAIGSSLPNASQHLAVLRSAGLVDGRREGPAVRYRLSEPAILDACDIVGGIVDRQQSARRSPVPAQAPAVPAAPAVPLPASTPAVPAG